MTYSIYCNGKFVNSIVSDEKFVSEYCRNNGYTFQLDGVGHYETNQIPTLEERIAALESAMLSMMGVNVNV